MPASLLALRATLLAATLIYASYQDLKRREVDDWVWLLSASIIGPLTLYNYFFLQPGDVLLASASVALISILAYAFYKADLYGGADAKSLALIALSIPLVDTGQRIHPFLGISTLFNGLVFSLIVPLSMLSLNLYKLIVRREDLFRGMEEEATYRKVLAVLVGTRVSSRGRFRFWGSMERLDSGGVRRFNFSPSIESFDRFLEGDGWATPAIPFIVFLTAGYLLDILWGDLFSVFLSLLFR